MTDPMFLIVAGIGSAFLFFLAGRIHRMVSTLLYTGTLSYFTLLSGYYLFSLLNGASAFISNNAGIAPPVGIQLHVGITEAAVMFCVNILLLLGSLYLSGSIRGLSVTPLALLLMITVGINGLIMTRDLFNMFVFLEILSIATYAFIAFDRNRKTLSAGFNYVIAGGLASGFLLLGIIFVYRVTGALNIDSIAENTSILSTGVGFTALLLIITALYIELKPFPANGWALDMYESVESGTVALIAVGHTAAVLTALYKLMPLLPQKGITLVFWAGVITFALSNLGGLKKQPVKRMLGFSSAAQVGLIASACAFLTQNSSPTWLLLTIAGGLFLNHFFAKAILFWLAGIINAETARDWKLLHRSPVLLIAFGIAVMALIGLPPFPGFFAKWYLFRALVAEQQFTVIIILAAGTLFEAAYMLHWFGCAVSKETVSDAAQPQIVISKLIPPVLFIQLLIFTGLIFARAFGLLTPLLAAPLLMALSFYIIDFLPAKLKSLMAIGVIAGYGWYIFPYLDKLGIFFVPLFLGGSALLAISTLNRTGTSAGFFPLFVLSILSIGALTVSKTALHFFYTWEMMAASSYILILRSGKTRIPAWLYILFSLGGALLMLMGFAVAAPSGTIETAIELVSIIGNTSVLPVALLLTGFLIKTAVFSMHIWLPGSYAESDDDLSAIISAVFSKVGIFGMLLVLCILGNRLLDKTPLPEILSWIGLATAFFGTLMAVFQEDIKYLLAYSSMGQVGLIIVAVSLMDHLGWVTALYLSVNHFLFKGLLFLAFAGVLYRTKTRYMYEMGGLIKRMPISFVSVLIAIIALSGVPPLSGFGGKWLLFTALLEKGWYFQLAVAFFSSTIAFLYCFRLIHTVFLGQAKAPFKNIRKAPFWILAPQFALIGGIMAISIMPQLIMKPLITIIETWYPSTLSWRGGTLVSSLGYWNGFQVMNIVMVLFGLLFVWMLFVLRKPQKVKQFNIVFAAERPHLPETTHVAYNFFAHYQKAFGFLVFPRATSFWNGAGEWIRSLSGALNNMYTGNGQTYAIHIILYVVVLYFITAGV
jgi:formate hydrogenlyase subunit 3/multisubunit Na+/H+ antiporter MnhD subunit